jgi:hypothetical protein
MAGYNQQGIPELLTEEIFVNQGDTLRVFEILSKNKPIHDLELQLTAPRIKD